MSLRINEQKQHLRLRCEGRRDAGQSVVLSLTLRRTSGKYHNYAVSQFARLKMISHPFGSELFRARTEKDTIHPEIARVLTQTIDELQIGKCRVGEDTNLEIMDLTKTIAARSRSNLSLVLDFVIKTLGFLYKA